MIAPKLYPLRSLLWACNVWFTPSSSGMQLGHKTWAGLCNMQHWRFISDWSCVFLEVLLTALYFRVTYCPHLQNLCSTHTSALCSWVPLGGTWEHEALVWVGNKLWRWGSKLPCGVYYCQFLDFFPVWGEQSVNHGWLCSGADVCQACGHRPLLHQSTVGLVQEWIPPRWCAQGLQISTKLQNESQVQLYFSLHFLHTNS